MVKLRSDRSEQVDYTAEELPVYVQRGLLSAYPNYRETAHWHSDIELILVISGSMKFSINGEIVALDSGKGLFVNAKQVHYGFSETREECDFLCVLFEPLLLYPSGPWANKYVLPVVNNAARPYCLFTEAEADGRLFAAIEALYRCREDADFGLRALPLCAEIWAGLYTMETLRTGAPKRSDPSLFTLQKMLAFLYEHFAEKLSLEDIARAGNVCKSGCIAVFRQYLHKTPIDYLIEYRLACAKELLLGSDHKVIEVGLEVGFQNVSYFIDMFKRAYGVTPLQMRRCAKQTDASMEHI